MTLSWQTGSFDLVGTIFYEIDERPYQTVFYNGTIEVVETGSFLSMESVFLATLGLALLGLLGVWIYGRFQQLTKVSLQTIRGHHSTSFLHCGIMSYTLHYLDYCSLKFTISPFRSHFV